MRAGGYLVVAKDPAAITAQEPDAVVFGPFVGKLNNGGDVVRLLNRNDRVMDQLEYQDQGRWPIGPDGSGATLSKRDAQSGSEDPGEWTSSPELGGTPGRENFPVVDLTPIDSTFVPLDASWRYEASGADLRTVWRDPAFDDSTWSQAQATFYAGRFDTIPPPDFTEVSAGGSILLENPSFEEGTNTGVGYGGVSSWFVTGGTGVNPASGGAAPFADNGSIPDGQQIAFIQGPGSLSQTVRGLDLTQQYWLQLSFNARSCCGANPVLAVSYAGQQLVPATPVTPVGGSNAYHFLSVPFTPAVSTGQLIIRNVGGAGDHSLLLDAVTLIERNVDQVVVQNPSFEAAGDAPPAPGYRGSRAVAGWTYEPGPGGRFGLNDASGPFQDNGIIPDGRLVAFLENSGSLHQTISGLEFGARYELQYSVNAQAAGASVPLQVWLDELLLHEEQLGAVGNGNPYHRRTHRFTATASSMELTFQQTLPNSLVDASLLIDQVSIRRLESPLVTELPSGPTTYYFRRSFEFTGDANRTELQLRSFLDDGAVVYLNGAEVFRQNMPAGAILAATPAATVVADPSLRNWQAISSTSLVSGRNVIGVEVHQAQANDVDMAFALELTATETPQDPTAQEVTLVINEIADVEAPWAAVELYNYGRQAVDLASLELWLEAETSYRMALPEIVLPTGAFTVFNDVFPGQLRTDGDRYFLVDPDQNRLIDAARIEQTVQGRVPDGLGSWYAVDRLTPNAPNQATLHDQIVINEIMYHPLPELAVPDQPATYERSALVPMTWNQWRYNSTGASLPSDWAQQVYPVDGQQWKLGQGLLGYETADLGVPINTQLLPPSQNNPRFLTYYFQTEFDLSADLYDQINLVELSHMIDTGAIFYLNGQELFRFNMPEGPIDARTRPSMNVNNAERVGPIEIPLERLKVGTNVLSAELHLRSETNSDVVFGAEIVVGQQSAPPIPGHPYREREDLEWIELYNRSQEAVDLTNWQLAGGIEYAFTAGTRIGPGQYLVIAADRRVLVELYPEIASQIIGDYSRSLSNQSDRIELLDSRHNLADVVQYSDGLGWPSAADGGGASLELRSPNADNQRPDVWAASVAADVPWQTFRYRAQASEPAGLAVPDYFHEFILGLLDEGVVLLDDLKVVEDPDGAAIERLQNGSFEGDSPGTVPDAWRIIGNHNQSEITIDPSDPSNHVLRLVATGPTEHMHNHAETTFASGARITEGQVFEVSLRAKWIHGSPQLNTRLYFSRAAQTTVLPTSNRGGTPGAVNSVWQANLGPTYSGLRHAPLSPDATQPVTVSVAAEDPDGLQLLRLYYSVDGQPFQSMPMLRQSDGRFAATIPRQAAGTTVQFYLEGTDGLGARSNSPAAGADSRALYRVQSAPLDAGGVHTLRLIMTADDVQWLHANENVMSNGRLGATVIYNDKEVFYDVRVRLRASGYGRQGGLAGFNIEFPAQQLFRGVHSGIALDRGVVLSSGTGGGGVSGRPGASAHELLIYQAAHHAGGIAAMYDDVVYIDAPRPDNTGLAQLKMARYSDVFLDSQFEDGGDGSLYKYELIYHSTRTIDGTPEAPKVAPNSVLATDISDLGDDKEAYRHNFILENNRARDDFDAIIALGKAFSLTGSALDDATQQVIDVDQWMRLFALHSLTGIADVYNMGLPHNLDLYVRPSDQKVLAFPWDVDHGFYYSPSSPLLGPSVGQEPNLRKVIALPANRRLFYKHLLDIVQTTYNAAYLGPWAEHYSQVTGLDLATFFQEYIEDRSQFVLAELARVAPSVSFEITTNGGESLTVDAASILLSGKGWIDIHSVQLVGSDEPVDLVWTAQDRWQIELPLQAGQNRLQLQAFDYQGRPVGADEILVRSTITERPLLDFLRVSELMYHPPDSTAVESA